MDIAGFSEVGFPGCSSMPLQLQFAGLLMKLQKLSFKSSTVAATSDIKSAIAESGFYTIAAAAAELFMHLIYSMPAPLFM